MKNYIGLLEKYLGSSIQLNNHEYLFQCPFHSHHKKKLQINLSESNSSFQHWHCWVCNRSGKKISSLFYKMEKELDITINPEDQSKFNINIQHDYVSQIDKNKQTEKISLPSSFISFRDTNHVNKVEYKNALRYLLHTRKLSKFDIIKYNLGYVDSGNFYGRIIIPSYDANGNINYFQARSYYDSDQPYKNPTVSKDIIGFDMYINWDYPVVLCEGALDAIAIKTNSIPLFGKTILPELKKQLASSQSKIILFLDSDAIKNILKFAEEFINQGKRIFIPNFDLIGTQDASDLGFEQIQTRIFPNLVELTEEKIMKYKIL